MDLFGKFYNFALRFLSYRPRSEREVRDKLKIKYQKSNIQNLALIIDKVIQKLKKQKFVNDEEFAKWWMESRIRFKQRSLRVIKLELRQKGIAQELIEKLIYDLGFTNNDLDNARKLVEKKIERLEKLPKEEIYQKLGRYLASKGFDWDTIKQAIDYVYETKRS